jgi:hypothetical protein
MDTEGTNVSTSLTVNPDDTQISLLIVIEEVELVDVSHTELLLDSRDKRRSLETGTLERFKSLLQFLDFVNFAVELEYGDVNFTGRLLGLNETSRVVKARDKATSDLRVKGTGVTSLLELQDLLDPGNDLMR